MRDDDHAQPTSDSGDVSDTDLDDVSYPEPTMDKLEETDETPPAWT